MVRELLIMGLMFSFEVKERERYIKYREISRLWLGHEFERVDSIFVNNINRIVLLLRIQTQEFPQPFPRISKSTAHEADNTNWNSPRQSLLRQNFKLTVDEGRKNYLQEQVFLQAPEQPMLVPLAKLEAKRVGSPLAELEGVSVKLLPSQKDVFIHVVTLFIPKIIVHTMACLSVNIS
jgi:hypothetical protein